MSDLFTSYDYVTILRVFPQNNSAAASKWGSIVMKRGCGGLMARSWPRGRWDKGSKPDPAENLQRMCAWCTLNLISFLGSFVSAKDQKAANNTSSFIPKFQTTRCSTFKTSSSSDARGQFLVDPPVTVHGVDHDIVIVFRIHHNPFSSNNNLFPGKWEEFVFSDHRMFSIILFMDRIRRENKQRVSL
ncbi:hypothetical protein AVEN_55291-1 [Araneus ventricosus]|uniref:Uncharacterized protein n=1 Tax=Araneus ventricosus TaxID=182803 RepID=A0A4Y2DA77_ARAVE|nr:hypothetical protein AVEN_55291-1 [Araneus ventricosus]